MDLAVDPTVVVDEGEEVVFVDDFGRDDIDMEAHVLVVLQGGIQVHVADVEGHEARTGCRDDTVEEEFRGGEAGFFGGWGRPNRLGTSRTVLLLKSSTII